MSDAEVRTSGAPGDGSAAVRKEYALGIDLGGTKVLCAVFGPDGTILARAKRSTRAHPEPEILIEEIAACAREAIASAHVDVGQVLGAGMGVPGPLDTETGVVRFAPNLGWHDVPAKDLLEKHLGVPVYLDNDVRMAMLAEHQLGAAKGTRRAIGVFVGTGVGGGLVIDGEIYRGAHTQAGEVGHIIVKAGGPLGNCGQHGCIEAMASRTAIARDLQEAVKQGKKTVLTKLAGKVLSDLGSGDLRKAIDQGDKLTEKVVARSAMYVGLGVAGLVNLLDPDIVVLGGGVVEAMGAWYVKRAAEAARPAIMSAALRDVPIVQSKLGDDAGVLGAAQLVRLRDAGPA